MTGFGSVHHPLFKIDIRSVNHRFTDIKIKLPKNLQPFEAEIKSLIQKQGTRGSIEVKVESLNAVENPSLDLQRFEKAYEQLQSLKSHFQIAEPIRLQDLLKAERSELFSTSSSHPSSTPATTEPLSAENLETFWETLRNCLNQWNQFKTEEGQRIQNYFFTTLDKLTAHLQHISQLRVHHLDMVKEKVTAKIQDFEATYHQHSSTLTPELLQKISLELALIIDRTDIQEELTRFQSHITELRNSLSTHSQESNGKKLEFILQELGREINTLGNKAQNYSISQSVIEIKTLLEQMREQILNVE
jgi:uncharacterized protein (TIGR00255 family)